MSRVPKDTKGRLIRVAVQVIGLAAGVASLWWCVLMALAPKNREQLEHLGTAPRGLIAGLAALSLATLVVNGLLFWIALAPARRLRAVDVIATNALSTFLGYVPLKAGALVRVLIHNRGDKVPLPTIGAWFMAVLVEMCIAFVPAIGVTLWLGRIDGSWAAAVAAAMAALTAATVVVARTFRGERGMERLNSTFGRVGLVRRLLGTKLWTQLHDGFDMLSAPWAVAGGALLRLLDIGTFAGRFLLAAKILSVPLSPAQALPVALSYFLIGVVSPSGLAGLREGGATVLFGSLFAAAGMASREARAQFAAVALLVTAVEAVSFLVGGAIGLAWLRPDRLLRLRAVQSDQADKLAANDPAEPVSRAP